MTDGWGRIGTKLLDLGSNIDALVAQRDRLQQAVDRACSALESSAYVGGPSEREAWQTAVEALQEVKTQHIGMAASSPTEGTHDGPSER